MYCNDDYGCPVPGCPVPGTPPPPKPPHHHHQPDEHAPEYWGTDGSWPLPPEHHHHHEKHCHPEPPPPPPTVVPPPIPPVRYVPGMDVQEQLRHMADHVNISIDRWNQIQGECYKTLNRMVGAAVSNDVYYEPDEVRFSTGFSSADGAPYAVIEAKPCDKAGRPIFCRLMTAYGAGDRNVRESILQKSFVSSANAIITAISPDTQWRGFAMAGCNPMATAQPQNDDWLCGWTKQGVLRILPASETTVESAMRNQLVDCIGPVIPIVNNGKATDIAANFSAEPGAIQAIGWKQCNGNKAFCSCGFNDAPGCKVKNVADLLVSMGVTTAVVTCYMTAYGKSVQSAKTENTTAVENRAVQENVGGQVETLYEPLAVVPEPWAVQQDGLSGNDTLGLTGGMAYIGRLAEQPLMFQIPQNSAFWVITKRHHKHWPNRWTCEIADICQKLGMNATQMESIQGKIDLEQKQILDLLQRMEKAEDNIDDLQQVTNDHAQRINILESDMQKAQTDIAKLQTDLSQEVQDRIAGDANLQTQINKEIQDRITADNKLTQDVTDIRNALTQEIATRNQADIDLSNAIQNEALARQTSDTAINTRIDLLQANITSDIAKEKQEREDADKNLQQQIDNLSNQNVNINAGVGLSERIDSSGKRYFDVNPGKGIIIDSNNDVTVDVGDGITIKNGKVTAKLSENLFINEKGEIDVNCNTGSNCCGTCGPVAGIGIDYSADKQTGELSLNLQPPTGGDIGGVKAGQNITIAPDGTISATGGGSGSYVLPVATTSTLGGVIVGDNLTADATGKVDAVVPVKDVQAGNGIDVSETNGVYTVGINASVQQDIDDAKSKADSASTAVNDMLPLAGGTMTGDIVMSSGSTVTGLPTPVNNEDAVNKEYVDNEIANVNGGINLSQLQQDVQTAQTTANDALPKAGGNMTGDIIFTSGSKATGLPTPVDDTDAATKKYVDDALTALPSGNYLPLSGGTITGNISMSSNQIKMVAAPSARGDAANKGYVDDEINKERAYANGISTKADQAIAAANVAQNSADTKLDLTGGTMTGAIDMGSNKISGLATPTANTDAANKTYVDTAVSGVSGDASTALTTAQAAQTAANNKLPLAGGTMSGAIAMGSNKITGLATPTANTDAATKAYVDNAVSNTNIAVLFTQNHISISPSTIISGTIEIYWTWLYNAVAIRIAGEGIGFRANHPAGGFPILNQTISNLPAKADLNALIAMNIGSLSSNNFCAVKLELINSNIGLTVYNNNQITTSEYLTFCINGIYPRVAF